jgi:predicted anti-sigma-YlaC factor YlaD
MSSHKLTCKETVELISDYLEGALLPEMQARFDQHLDTCPGCNIYLNQMRQTIQTLRQLTDETTPPEQKQELLQLFQIWQKDQKMKPSSPG